MKVIQHQKTFHCSTLAGTRQDSSNKSFSLYISNQLNGKTLHNGQLPACNVQTNGEPITKKLIYTALVLFVASRRRMLRVPRLCNTLHSSLNQFNLNLFLRG